MKKNKHARNILMDHVKSALVKVLVLSPETIITEATIPRADTNMDDVYSVLFMANLELTLQHTLDENYFVPTEVVEREKMYQYRPLSDLLDYLEKTVDISKIPKTATE